MSHVKIWIHLVFSTKHHQPLFTKEIRHSLFEHIRENARGKGIWLDYINGYSDHVHCLISLGKDQSIGKLSQLIKGESSNWINKQDYFRGKFFWQDDYFAVSVGSSQVEVVRKYIRNQENHHQKKSFTEEVKAFLEKYGWDKETDVGLKPNNR